MQSFRNILAAFVLAFCLMAQVYVRTYSQTTLHHLVPEGKTDITIYQGPILLHEHQDLLPIRLHDSLRLTRDRHGRRPRERHQLRWLGRCRWHDG